MKEVRRLLADIFLSTPSARRATAQRRSVPVQLGISIHALREEGDDCSEINRDTEFISIHALREEGDPRVVALSAFAANFYPRPPRGGRPPDRSARCWRYPISIHALREEGDPEIW